MVEPEGSMEKRQAGAKHGSPRSAHLKILVWAFAVCWTAAIVVLCSLPGEEMPDPPFTYSDKVGHFVAFGVLGWAWLAALGRGLRPFLVTMIGGTVFAALTELYQAALPWQRSADPVDWIFDTAGLVLGGVLWLGWRRICGTARSPER